MERTYIMVKPDGVQRGLVGEIVSRFEQKGFKLVAGKLCQMSKDQAARHYAEHEGKPFYEELIQFITSGPVFAMVWEGDEVIQLARKIIGKTKVLDAEPGTIRGDFAAPTNFNLIHGADSPESAAREISNMFSDEELLTYELAIHKWT